MASAPAVKRSRLRSSGIRGAFANPSNTDHLHAPTGGRDLLARPCAEGLQANAEPAADALPFPRGARSWTETAQIHAQSSTATRWATTRSIPRTVGASFRMTARPIRVSPRPRSVARCGGLVPIALRLRVALMIRSLIVDRSTADLPQALATTLGQRRRLGELAERFHSGADHVVGVVRADALGEHGGDSRQLHDRPHPASCDDARALRGRLEEHGARAEVAGDGVGDRPVHHRHPDHLPLRFLDPLADRLGDLLRLAEAEADTAAVVTHHHEGAETEPSPALHHLGDAVDVHHLLLELLTTRVRDDAPRTAKRSFLSHLT